MEVQRGRRSRENEGGNPLQGHDKKRQKLHLYPQQQQQQQQQLETKDQQQLFLNGNGNANATGIGAQQVASLTTTTTNIAMTVKQKESLEEAELRRKSVLIANLRETIQKERLQALFVSCGEIIDIQWRDAELLVEFDCTKAAEKAVKFWDQSEMDGKQITIRLVPYEPPTSTPDTAPPPPPPPVSAAPQTSSMVNRINGEINHTIFNHDLANTIGSAVEPVSASTKVRQWQANSPPQFFQENENNQSFIPALYIPQCAPNDPRLSALPPSAQDHVQTNNIPPSSRSSLNSLPSKEANNPQIVSPTAFTVPLLTSAHEIKVLQDEIDKEKFTIEYLTKEIDKKVQERDQAKARLELLHLRKTALAVPTPTIPDPVLNNFTQFATVDDFLDQSFLGSEEELAQEVEEQLEEKEEKVEEVVEEEEDEEEEEVLESHVLHHPTTIANEVATAPVRRPTAYEEVREILESADITAEVPSPTRRLYQRPFMMPIRQRTKSIVDFIPSRDTWDLASNLNRQYLKNLVHRDVGHVQSKFRSLIKNGYPGTLSDIILTDNDISSLQVFDMDHIGRGTIHTIPPRSAMISCDDVKWISPNCLAKSSAGKLHILSNCYMDTSDNFRSDSFKSAYSVNPPDISLIEPMAFDKRGTVSILTAGKDNNIYLWRSETVDFHSSPEFQITQMFGHSSPLGALCYKKQNNLLFSGGNDGRLIIYDVNSGAVCYDANSDAPISEILPISGHDHLVVIGSGESEKYDEGGKCTLAIFDARTHSTRPEFTFDRPYTGTGSRRYKATIHPDGHILCNPSPEGLIFWDLRYIRPNSEYQMIDKTPTGDTIVAAEFFDCRRGLGLGLVTVNSRKVVENWVWGSI